MKWDINTQCNGSNKTAWRGKDVKYLTAKLLKIEYAGASKVIKIMAIFAYDGFNT